MNKRTIGILAGIATLGAGAWLSSHLWAQQPGFTGTPAAAAAPPQTRIALINLGQVFRQYAKFKQFEDQLKSDRLWYGKQLEEKKGQIAKMQADIATKTDPNARDQAEHDFKQAQRSLQDQLDEINTKMQKKEFEELVQTYKEVQDIVTKYARSNGIELVMHYNDGIGADAFSPQIFSRKLANGACQPIYVAEGMDITGVIVSTLNSSMAAAPSSNTGTYRP